MSENNNLSYITKSKKIREHLKEKGTITTWEAITLYGATRLSAIIFDFRKDLITTNSPFEILTIRTNNYDRNGKKSNYAKYVYQKKGSKILEALQTNKNLTQTK